jgi:hypothetical protein
MLLRRVLDPVPGAGHEPTGGDASVQQCQSMDRAQPFFVPVMGIGGVDVPAHSTRTVRATSVLPIKGREVAGLVGEHLSCTGLDWHGNPPI